MNDLQIRLARAVHLDVEQLPDHTWRVLGGALEHLVSADATTCDCADFAMRGGACKHLLAVELRRGDPATLLALRELVPLPRPPQRHRRGLSVSA